MLVYGKWSIGVILDINVDAMCDKIHDLKFDDYVWSAKIYECCGVGGKIDEIVVIDKVKEIEEEIVMEVGIDVVIDKVEELIDKVEDIEELFDNVEDNVGEIDKVMDIVQDIDKVVEIDVEFGKVGLIAIGKVDACDEISDELLGIMDNMEWIFGIVDGEVIGVNKGNFKKKVPNQVSVPREGFWRGDVRSDMLR